MQVDIWQLVAIITGNSGAIMTLALFLHKRRDTRMRELSDRIMAAEARAAADHKALALQIIDLNLTHVEHYVRKDDLMPMLRDMKTEIMAGNHSIDKVSERVDELFKSVEWRKGTR